ncbi:MAG TPA: TadE family protein [Acidimicrobiia bacterium]|nr:TadE family protein [Acidimicrobiia bacterium]
MAVEFALVLPVLVLLLFGIIEFGRGYNAQISLQGAVREGARALAIGNGDPVAAVESAAPSLSGIAVTTSGAPCAAGTTASVTASYPFTYNVPLFGTATKTLTATGVMRCGG